MGMDRPGHNILRALRLIFIAGLAVATGPIVYSQTSQTRPFITGVVQDQQGGTIANATVELFAGEKMLQTSVTDTSGKFQFAQVPAGTYQIKAASSGFEPQIISITVGNVRPETLTISMAIAQVRTEITVDNDESQTNTDASANKDAVAISGDSFSKLPVFDQDFVGAMSRFVDTGSTGNGGVTLVVNGMEVNNLGVSASAIKEIKINQDPYSAEFQRPGRGRIEVFTKPGTPEFHGAFNFTFRDAHLNARDPFALTRPPEQRRIYEGVFTGPVGNSKKTSFLISVNRNEEDRQAIVFAQGPSGIINANVATPVRNMLFAVQLNHSFSEKNNISIRYSDLSEATDDQGVGGNVLAEAGIKYRNNEREINYSQEIVLSPNLVNNFRMLVGAER